MKKFLLIIIAFATLDSASAQFRHPLKHQHKTEPTVYLISVRETDTLRSADPSGKGGTLLRQAVVSSVIEQHRIATRRGRQQASAPSAIFADKDNAFSFAIGGDVAMRASYSFNNAVGNTDMVPYDIPMSSSPDNKQALGFSATTSRIFIRGIANTKRLGEIHIFFDVDFRGGSSTNYTPRCRSGYVSMLGITLGRDVTTFCDLTAAPTTIDFQGPNAYNYYYTTMIRYEHSLLDNHLKMGIAAEMPSVTASYGENFMAIPQRVPDIPLYIQYAWGKHRQSHIRVSAVFRDMYLANKNNNRSDDLFGWGVQFSGNIHLFKRLQLFMNGTYGEGIARYIQDLATSHLDFTPRPSNIERAQATPMYGWQVAAQYNIFPNLFVSGGYSTVRVCKNKGVFSPNQYRNGEYIFGNIFWNMTPRFTLAAEYLHGSRKNMDGAKAHANRINILAKYSF